MGAWSRADNEVAEGKEMGGLFPSGKFQKCIEPYDKGPIGIGGVFLFQYRDCIDCVGNP
jgi:hypothetical protein